MKLIVFLVPKILRKTSDVFVKFVQTVQIYFARKTSRIVNWRNNEFSGQAGSDPDLLVKSDFVKRFPNV